MNRASLLTIAAGFVLAATAYSADAPKLEVVRTAGSGPWSKAATWEGGKLPVAGSNVLIRTGHQVVYDVDADTPIRSVHIGGRLIFDPTRDTKLVVGLVKIQPGEIVADEGFDCDAHAPDAVSLKDMPVLEVGSAEKPIPFGKKAIIRLIAIEGTNKESWPAIVCCGGRMDFHGAPMNRTWVKFGAAAAVGDKKITLAEPVTGWKVGDMIILTPADANYNKTDITEERRIVALDGTKITLDKPLERVHFGTGDFRSEVANLSRNVVVESANPEGERGHTMYHRNSAGSISYAEFRHLGKKNVLGRYSLHFHLCGDTMRGSSVVGASIWDSHNRWVTIHGTNYLLVRDCVGYKSVGHGYFMEDGTEVYNVLDRNLAVGCVRGNRLPKQVLPFDGNEGAGFWWACSLNTFTRNVAAANALYGFRFEATQSSSFKLDLPVLQPNGKREKVDIRTLPFVRFEDNEVHSNYGLYGINLGEGVNRVGPDAKHPFIVRNTKIWNVHYGFRPQVPSLLVENMTIQSAYGVYHPNFDNHVYRNLTIMRTNTEPFNRGHDDLSIQYGRVTVDGLTFDGIRSGGMPLIQISDDNPNGAADTHMRNVKTINWTAASKAQAIVNLGGGPRPQPKTEKGVPIYLHDWFGAGRHAMVVSIRSPEYKAAPDKFRSESPLTGDESRVAEVKDIPFPELLQPVDDLPPATIVTSVVRQADGKLLVRGTSSDNGTIKKVNVNGQEAKSTATNYSSWEIVIADASTVSAHAEDEKGNVESMKHVVSMK
ncbi:MAG: G8 domain-containing protein [Planctomycetes bacterium]|nr:G8 domain-containing protein [Planctomycetota bacterium]